MICVRDGRRRYVVLRNAVAEEKRLDDVLRRRVIDVELADESHELCERDDLLIMKEVAK